MWRWLFHIVAVLSTLLFVLVTFFWIRSAWYADVCEWLRVHDGATLSMGVYSTEDATAYSAYSVRGHLVYNVFRIERKGRGAALLSPAARKSARIDQTDRDALASIEASGYFVGFGHQYVAQQNNDGVSYSMWTMPYYALS